MNTDDTQTWISGGYKKYRDDYFETKNSAVESLDYDSRFSDAPAPNRSRAALILTEVEEQLEANETRYNSVKDRFNYIKMLYMRSGTIPSEIVDSKTSDEAPATETSYPRDTAPNSPLDDDNGSEDHIASGGTQYYDFDPETKHEEDRRRNEIQPHEESPRCSARSSNGSPRRNIYRGIQDENSSDSGRQIYFSEETSDGMKNFVRSVEPTEDVAADDTVQIHGDHEFNEISTSIQHPYQLHLAEYSKSIHKEFEETSRDAEPASIDRNQQLCFNDHRRSASEQEAKDDELYLNQSGSAESVRTMKKKKSRSEKQRRVVGGLTSGNKKNGAKQVDDTLCGTSKIRRKKRRVKASNSRSTTATRDTHATLETKKDVKKRKPRGNATMPASQLSQHRHDTQSKIHQNWSEVVEMYYNNAHKSGSLSVVSSKHSKLEPRRRNVASANTYDQRTAIKDLHQLTETNDLSKRTINDAETRRSLKSQKNNQRNDDEEIRTQPKIHQQALKENSGDLRSGESKKTKLLYRSECPTIQSDNNIPDECNDYRNPPQRIDESPECVPTSYDPLAIRNYELPTVASKMKRVNRSYFNRFNFKNIPFVVGTSVTPSYNLGLNIQETLSLIKTRQMMPGGVTPLLISKVSKGVQPVSTLLGSVGGREDIPMEHSGFRFDVTSAGMCNIYSNQMANGDRNPNATLQLEPLPSQTPRITCVPTNQSFLENQQSRAKSFQLPSEKKSKIQSICSSMKIKLPKNAERHLQLTQSTLLRQRQEELNIGDSQSTKWHNVPQNMNGIRDVLANFHDQFEAMNSKYEKLQEEAEKTNDESLKKEIAILEKELTAKEEQIQAVVNLYMEVMALKQQMKLLHERNSLVCIATESPGSPMYPQISSMARTANPMFSLHRRCGSGYNRGPSTSTRLAGLLRQIKIFQKQLKSAT